MGFKVIVWNFDTIDKLEDAYNTLIEVIGIEYVSLLKLEICRIKLTEKHSFYIKYFCK